MKMGVHLKIKFGVLLIFSLLTLTLLYVVARETREGELMVAFLNIGQGDAIFIESPTGRQVLLDGGAGRSVLRELGKMLPFYDKSIDLVVASHPDTDHIGGLVDVFDRYKVDLFMESGVEADNSSYKVLKERLKKEGSKQILARRGMLVELGGGARLEILFPDRDPAGLETNTASIVARLVYGESEFLLTGDSPIAIEKYLISLEDAHQGKLKSDVLKVGHHGSRTSTSEAFVEAVSPQYAIISAGKNNSYHHPHQEVLDTLNKSNIKILRTDLSGRIVFKSNGVNLEVRWLRLLWA